MSEANPPKAAGQPHVTVLATDAIRPGKVYWVAAAFIVSGLLAWLVPKLFSSIQAIMNGWQTAVLVLGAIFLVRLLLAPYWLYQEKATSTSDEVDIPNMSIREVFFHIDPDILENDTDDRLERASKDIRDKLSTNQALSWGRKINPQNKTRSALTKIPNDYWTTTQFTYFFLSEGQEDCGHCWRPNEGGLNHEYADIQMNRIRVETLWPARPKRTRSA